MLCKNNWVVWWKHGVWSQVFLGQDVCTSTCPIFIYPHDSLKSPKNSHPLILDTFKIVTYYAHSKTKEHNVDHFMLINIIQVKCFERLYKWSVFVILFLKFYSTIQVKPHTLNMFYIPTYISKIIFSKVTFIFIFILNIIIVNEIIIK